MEGVRNAARAPRIYLRVRNPPNGTHVPSTGLARGSSDVPQVMQAPLRITSCWQAPQAMQQPSCTLL